MPYHPRSTPSGGNSSRSNRNTNRRGMSSNRSGRTQRTTNRMTNNRMTNNRQGMTNNRQGMTNNPNPVTETFLASSGQYQYTNGLVVPPNTQLHRHRDGTVMLGHDPNQMGQQVVRVDKRPFMTGGNGNMRSQQSSDVVNRQQRQRGQQTRTSTARQSRMSRQLETRIPRYYHRDGRIYSGPVINLNGEYYTTTTGAMEGRSVLVTRR